jgi:hypothetical protein
VDDCKLSHESPEVIDETIDWLREEYESIFEDGSGAMKVHRGKVHKYLGMTLDFSNKGQCVVTMFDYLDGIVKAGLLRPQHRALVREARSLDEVFTRLAEPVEPAGGKWMPGDLR